MRLLKLFLLLVLIGSFSFVSSPALARKPIGDLPKASEKNQVQKWMIVRQVIDGNESKNIKGCFLLFTKRGFMQHHSPKGPKETDGTIIYRNMFYRYRGVGKVSQIDMSTNPDWTEIEQGITTIKDGMLYICHNNKGQARPENFKTGKGDGNGYILTVYKRVKIK